MDILVMYLLLCLIPFGVILAAIKWSDDFVTVGDFLSAILLSLIPFLNLYICLCGLYDLLQRRGIRRFFSRILF